MQKETNSSSYHPERRILKSISCPFDLHCDLRKILYHWRSSAERAQFERVMMVEIAKQGSFMLRPECYYTDL